jgi:hypothetical protein
MIKPRLVVPKAMFAKITQVEKRTFWVKSYALILGVFFSASCLAVELYVRPTFSLRTEYSDNKQLSYESDVRRATEKGQDVDTSAYGIITSAEARAGAKSDNYDVFFKGKVDVKKYFSDQDLDTEDFFLDLDARYDLDFRNTFGFSAGYSQESTLTSELDVTGETQDNVPRTNWSISPEWQHNLSETKYIQVSYSHKETSYEEEGTATTTTRNRRYSDYTYDIVSLSFYHQWNDKLLNNVTAGWSRFAVPKDKNETDEFTIQGGLEYEISETWSASLMGGGRYTLTDRGAIPSSIDAGFDDQGRPFIRPIPAQPAFSDSQLGLIFSFATNKKFERGHIGASYSRTTSPTGNGRLQTVDRFDADSIYKITEHLHFLLDGGIHITKATADENSDRENRDRTYYFVTPQLRWQFNRQLSLSGGYQYRRQERDVLEDRDPNVINPQDVVRSTIPDTAQSHSVFLTLRYEWDKFRTQDFY